jgi:hypothetical protein
MGYEVIYKFHERLPDGKYAEEVKETKKTVGKVHQEIPLSKLATVIMSQLARRDIWIIDVDIFEYTKKKISFKEPMDGKGLILKGKRFNITGQEVDVEVEEFDEEMDEEFEEPQAKKSISRNKFPPNNLANRASNKANIKSYMVFDPEIQNLHEARQKNLKFTVENKYPIYLIEDHPLGLTYGQIFTTVDDTGKTVTVSDKFFVPASVTLYGDNEVEGGFSGGPKDRGVKLTYDEAPREIPLEYRSYPLDGQEKIDMSVPSLRR